MDTGFNYITSKMAAAPVERTGVVQDETTGETFIPASRRPDGTWRKPRRVKDGYIPQDEMPVYESKGTQWLKNKPGLPPGLNPSDVSTETKQNVSTDYTGMSKAAKKNAKRKEKKKQQHSGQSEAAVQKVTQSLAGTHIQNNQSEMKVTLDQTVKQADACTGSKDEINKKLKNLRKKLKQIETLEEKITSGELKQPEKEQLEKISRKQSVLDEIEDLELELEDL